jgi:DNA repair exonuclease SbcCD ATPase subunit
MPRIILRRVELSGFGPYRDSVVVDLDDGLNVLSASNETGKSSLVSGIAAIIFGIPQTSDQVAFGQGRFRNWFNPRRFEGKLDFLADGVPHHIERDFDSNRISFSKEEGGKWKEISTGEHNPGARHRNTSYEAIIQQLFGMTNRELFEATFCLIQPLPESETLDERLQGLLSGSGKSFEQSLDKLANELKEYTRFTGEKGVTPRDLREARQLENLSAKIESLQQAIAQEQGQVDEFEELKKNAAALREQKQKAEADYQLNKGVLDAMGEWKMAAERYRMSSRNRMELENAVQNAAAIEQRVNALESQIVRDYPEFIDAPAETGTDLDNLINMDAAIRQTNTKEQQYAETHAQLEAELAAYDASGEGSEAATALGKDGGTVHPSSSQQDRRTAPASAPASALARWGAFGSAGAANAVVRSIRRAYAEFLKRWEEDEQSQRALADCQTRLAELSVFDSFAPSELELLGSPKERASQLQSELGHQEMLLSAAKHARASAIGNTIIFSILTAIVVGAAAYLLSAPLVAVTVLAAAGAAASWLIQSLIRSRRRAKSAAGAAGATSGKMLEPGKIEEAVKQAQHEVERFTASVQPLIKRFGDLDGVNNAYLDWQTARSHEQNLKNDLTRFETEYLQMGRADLLGDIGTSGAPAAGAASASFGAPATHGATPCPDHIGELVDFARKVDPTAHIDRLADLAFWVRTVAARKWEVWLAETIAYEQHCLRKSETIIRLDAHHRELLKIRQDLDQLKQQRNAAATTQIMVPVMAAAADDPVLARKRWQSRTLLREELANERSALNGILAVQGVSDVTSLKEKQYQAFDAVSDAFSRWKGLIEAMPGLPATEAADDPAAIEMKLEQLRAKEHNLRRQVETLTDLLTQNADKLRGIQGQNPLNIAEAEQRLADLQREKAELTELVEALTLAHHTLRESIVQYQAAYRDRLAAATTAFFAQLSGVPEEERHVELDEGFHLSVVSQGRASAPVQLSRGAQDQLYIALRLAIAELLSGGVDLPFIFDDPFLNCDSERLELIRDCLVNRADEQQLLLLTHREDFDSWGRKVALTEG